MEQEPRIFLIAVSYFWGRGITIKEAKANCRKEGYSGTFPDSSTLILSFPKSSTPYIDGMGCVNWKGKIEDKIIIQEPQGLTAVNK